MISDVSPNNAGSHPDYLNESLDFKTRARDLVSKMTLDEKVTQMVYNSAAIPRLGVPSYNWWNEALHGIARGGIATVFPQAIAMAATFDDEMMLKVADIISTEARAKFHENQRKNDHGMYKGISFWSPNVNIFRDPRWGRGHETYGEDPYLTSRMGVAFVRGLQGNDDKYLKAAACAKHYAVHSGPETGRHSFNAEVSKKDLRETYLPAFKALCTEAKVEAVMGAYNRTNGEPCCGSKTLLGDILRDEWQFDGHVVSDCWAIKDFHEGHAVTHTAPQSVAMALNNGCDLNCGNMYLNMLIALNEGLITEETIDQAVTRIVTTRMRLGLFDDAKNVKYTSIPYSVNACEEHRSFALDVSRRSMVLLKNSNNTLPLNREKIKTIAVIGPNADSREAMAGNYFGTPEEYVTVLAGIREAVAPGTRVLYAPGCHLFLDRTEPLAEPGDRLCEAVSVAEMSDVVIMCLGLNPLIEGEEGDASNSEAGGDKRSLDLLPHQQKLLEAVYATGKPVILVLLAGSALAVRWADEKLPAIVQAWYPGAEGGRALASVLFGDTSPSGRLPVTFYRTTEELPDFCDYSMENRTYRFMKNEALYPFGFGLSYTTFDYSPIEINKTVLQPGENLEVSVTVTNTGSMAGYETVQLYLKDLESAITRLPNYQLSGTRAVYLDVGQSTTISFTVTPSQMSLINDDGQRVLEPGSFNIYVGGSQPDTRSVSLTGQMPKFAGFSIQGELLPLPY